MMTDDVKQPAADETPQPADVTQQAWFLNLKARKQQCYCCGHVNPNAAYECEKCYVGL
jgi:hypothetical protein